MSIVGWKYNDEMFVKSITARDAQDAETTLRCMIINAYPDQHVEFQPCSSPELRIRAREELISVRKSTAPQ